MRHHSFLRLFLPLALSLPFVFYGCSKEPGEGGKALIRGKVFAVEINDNTGFPTGDSFYYPEQRVYIRYGDGDFYDDDTRTGPNGEYEFRWLRKGMYTVFTYSECPQDCESELLLVQRTVSIDEKKAEVEVPVMRVEVWNNP